MLNKRIKEGVSKGYNGIIKLVCLVLVVAFANSGAAQSILFRNYTVNNGLSSNTIWNIVQDDNGYMWFGTKNGLNRFDGYQFRTYQVNDLGKNASFGNSFIHSICKVDGKTLWVGTEEGLFSFDLSTEKFHKYEELKSDLIFSIIKDKKGGIWVGTRSNGLFHFPNGSKKFKNYRAGAANGLSLNQIRRLQEDDQGRIWIGTFGEGIDIFDPGTGKFEHVKAGPAEGQLSSNYILSLYKDASGSIWVGTLSGGLNKWDKHGRTFKVFRSGGSNGISDNIVRAIYQPNDSTFYIGTEKGLNVYDVKQNTFTAYTSKTYDPYSISDNAVYSIFPDREGGIWVGTYFGGVNYFSPKGSGFELYYSTGEASALSGNAVSCFLEDKPGYLWVGTENGGLNYFDVANKSFQRYPFAASQESLSYGNIHALFKDKLGNIWIGTYSGGLNIYNPKTGRVKRYHHNPADPTSLSNNSIYSIYADKQGTIWVGTVKGLNIYDEKNDAFIRVNDMDLQNSCIYEVLEDGKGNIWVGTYEQGLLALNRYTNKWMRYSQSKGQNAISSNKVISIHDDGKGNLWLGTDGGGLNRFNIEKRTFASFGPAEGVSTVVFGILPDSKGNLWLSTNNGILRFDPSHNKTWSYANVSNLQSRLFNYNAYHKTSDGKLYFGGIKGFNAFYPEQIEASSSPHNIVLTNFKLFNKDVDINDEKSPLSSLIGYTDNIKLKHNQSVVSFEYAALSFKNPAGVRYAYKMEGFDADWNDVGSQRIATYTNLPPGSYTFKVRSTDQYGNWSNDYAEVKVAVRPPFYRSTLAYILYALLIAAGIYLLRDFFKQRERRRNRIKLEKMKAQREHEFYQQKIDFFTTMAHEIRTPLSLIMAPLEKLKGDKHKPETVMQLDVMEENAERLRTLVNQLLDFRRIESDIYTIRKEKVELISFIHSVYSRFSAMASQKGIRFSLSTDINKLQIQADPEALQKILSNLLVNAFKFAKSAVEIKVSVPVVDMQPDQTVSIAVIDDGIGIPQNQLEKVFTPFFKIDTVEHKAINIGGTGIGLSLARALAEKHQGGLRVESKPRVQTVFTLEIPYEVNVVSIEKYKAKDADYNEQKTDQFHILIVEDDVNMLEYIASNLKTEGYDVICAENGKEALKVLDTNTVELVISDVMMPEMDGMELCKAIKNNIDHSHIAVMLLTAKGNSETEIQGIESGADAYVLKPFKWKHLTASIKNLLENRMKLKEKFGHQPFADVSVLTTNTHDKNFIEKITAIIEERIDDYQLSVEELSKELGMSRSTLHKKLKAISGHVPNEFIRIIRLKNAAKLLITGEHNISEVGYKTGFNSPSYFSRCFIQQFKLTPTEFVEKYQAGGVDALKEITG